MRADPSLVEENRNILETVAAARPQAVSEEEGGEVGMEDEDVQDTDAGQEEEEDNDEGMLQAFYEDYMPDSDENMPDHEEDEGDSSIEEESYIVLLSFRPEDRSSSGRFSSR